MPAARGASFASSWRFGRIARAYLVGKLMRQAKPDDVFLFVRPREIRELWPRLTRYLGRTREFWSWLFETWEGQGCVWR